MLTKYVYRKVFNITIPNLKQCQHKCFTAYEHIALVPVCKEEKRL